jgi:2-amino-4-hydroxy-6-hydroxymethyldihydropteridine diphosphokinase
MKPPSDKPVEVAIGLGSNVGDRSGHLHAAIGGIGTLQHTTVLAISDLIETLPVGPVPQGPYVNAAAVVRTALTPRDFLDAMLEIERSRGRDRALEQRWGPRTLDLDLLLYADQVIDEPGLTVPHPHLHQRRFVLAPLAQIAPGWRIPGLDRTVSMLLAELDRSEAVQESTCQPRCRL